MSRSSAVDGALGQEAVELVRNWLERSDAVAETDVAAARLAGVLKDPNGLAFTVGFVDGVMRPEDLAIAAQNLAEVSRLTPEFLPWYLKAAIRVGGLVAPGLPKIVIPIARRALRDMVGHLVLDAEDEALSSRIAEVRAGGNRLNLNLLGEAVLGQAEADRRLAGTMEFLARPDVDYVSIKVSSVVSQLDMWSFDQAVEQVVTKLTPLYELAASAATPKFINLDMEEYRDLDLTVAVFRRMLEQPQLKHLEAGIVLQAYIPDARQAMEDLTNWALARVKSGGARIKVRLVKGANLAMERVDAQLHDWPVATVPSKQAADANYKRMLRYSLKPEHTQAVRLGVAGHNLFDLAYAWLLAKQNGVTADMEFEMLLGMATAQAKVISEDVGALLLYTPVVKPSEFDAAIAYLVRRLEENSSSDNFMSALFDLGSSEELFARERDRFLSSLEDIEREPDSFIPQPSRNQDRSAEQEQLKSALKKKNVAPGGFHNERDTDPSIEANRKWGRAILANAQKTEAGKAEVAKAKVSDAAKLSTVIGKTKTAGAKWGAQPAAARAAILHRAGVALAAMRSELIEVMVAEAGKTIAEADVEVSEAVDFAHYYAERALELDNIPGAKFVPSELIVVTPPWNFPVAIPAGGVLAALASGSGVVFKPASRTARSGAMVAKALWEAGVPKAALALVSLGSRELGTALVSDERVDRVILTGSIETAIEFAKARPDLGLLAETSGKNAIIVTPSADMDLAANDVVKSAFGHAGQKCSAASLVILVGSVATSERFRHQLVDAAQSIRVGWSTDATTRMSQIVAPAEGKLLRALTTLEEGQEWLLQPKKLDDAGQLWTPGIRTGVQPGSEFHMVEYFGPVLGIMTAETLDEAIELQNAVEYGLTAGIHSLDPFEVNEWIERVHAGNLYVNRGITGAIVQRQPFGGWKRSVVGPTTKAGGPSYLFALGNFEADPSTVVRKDSLHLRGIERRVANLIETSQSALSLEEYQQLRAACLSDAAAWEEEFSQAIDRSGLNVEHNVLRYRNVPTAIRIGDNTKLIDALRVIAAALLTQSPFTLSSAIELPVGVQTILNAAHIGWRIESGAAWHERLSVEGTATLSNGTELAPTRVRLVTSSQTAAEAAARVAGARKALGANTDVAFYGDVVTAAGRVELLPFLREQSVTVTAHRFGNPTAMSTAVVF